jgi:hypothetical protein
LGTSGAGFTDINNLVVAVRNAKVALLGCVVGAVAVGRGGLLCNGRTRCQQESKEKQLLQSRNL